MNDQLDKELTNAMTEALKPTLSQPLRPPPMPPQAVQLNRANEGSLIEQWEKMERIQWELKQRVMDGRLTLENEYRQRRHEIEYQHERAMMDAQLTLEAKRDKDLKALAEEIRERLREFEALKDRLDG